MRLDGVVGWKESSSSMVVTMKGGRCVVGDEGAFVVAVTDSSNLNNEGSRYNVKHSMWLCFADSQCRSRTRNCPWFDPSILRHSGIWGAADDAVLNIVHKKEKSKKSPFKAFLDSHLNVNDMFACFISFQGVLKFFQNAYLGVGGSLILCVGRKNTKLVVGLAVTSSNSSTCRWNYTMKSPNMCNNRLINKGDW